MHPTRLALVLFLLALACQAPPVQDPTRAEWLRILRLKSDFQKTDAAHAELARQKWVDALAGFVRSHPDHQRATAVYNQVELEFARELRDTGHDDEALLHYRSILERNPEDSVARQEMDAIVARDRVGRDSFDQLQLGMSRDDVSNLLGHPNPAWTRSSQKGGHQLVSWYYRKSDGGLAAVHFSDDRMIAAEFE